MPDTDDRSLAERLSEAEEALAKARTALERAESGLETAEKLARTAEESKTKILWVMTFLTVGIALIVYLTQRES